VETILGRGAGLGQPLGPRLGESFDIHGGGLDLQFPHHENEIAQSACAHPHGAFAKVWMHNEMLLVEGKKMSKSLGNFFTVRDLLDQGIPGEVIRFVLLSTHYGKPMDWTAEKAQEASTTLSQWLTLTDGTAEDEEVPEWMLEHLANDLNTAGFVGAIHQMATVGKAGVVRAAMKLLGLPAAESVSWFRSRPVIISLEGSTDRHFASVRSLLTRWQNLRDARQFAEADELKSFAEAAGLRLAVRKDGPHAEVLEGFDPAKLESLQ
jgi:cysteinyl-tRNA synthetase